MDYILSSITVLVTLITGVYLYSKWRYSYWRRKGVYHIEPEFFYGNAKEMVKGNLSMAETYRNMYKKFKAAGVKYAGSYTIFRPIFVAMDPGLIKDIMQKNFEHFTAHFIIDDSHSVFNKTVFHLQDEPWRSTRKKLTPTFTSGKMKMMFETLLEKTTGLGELAGELAESGEAVNIKEILGRFTTDVIGSCGFGLECNSLKNPDSDFLKHGRLIFDPPAKKANLFDLIIAVITGRRQRKDIKPTEEFFKNVVTETIDYREKNNIYRKDFMHLMIQLKNRGVVTDDDQIFNKSDKPLAANTFDVDEITAQCILFFIAGFETSATTMTFALLELAQNQDIQQKVRDEANAILKKHDGKMTYEAMMELTYTEKVIQETLRKYPPVASIPRVCTKKYTIPDTDVVIEKGTVTIIPAWGLHMDPEYFPDPEKFDPERFSEENKGNIRDYTYLPFGEGPRMCLGLRFGMMQSKVGLISLVRNYNFTLHKNTTFPLKMQRDAFITAVDGDVWLNITKAN